MPYGNDPLNSLTDRLRLEVGDIDPYDEGLTDEVYQFILDVNGDTTDVSTKSIIQALKYLVSKYANYDHEEAGDLEIWGDRFEQYRKLLDDYLKDPRFGAQIPMPYAGGISKSDILTNRLNPDNNRVQPHEDWFKEPYFTSEIWGRKVK